jgi:uncharacterized protein (TIGR03000 family)
MRYLIALACAAALSGAALAQPVIKVQPFVPPRPARPGMPAPLVIFPSFAAYYASAFFWAGSDNSNFNALYYPQQPAPVVQVVTPPPPPDYRAKIVFHLPRASTEVWIDNEKLEQTGVTQTFVTPSLDPTKWYEVKITARWYEDGKEKRNTLTLPIKAGEEPVVTILGGLTKK